MRREDIYYDSRDEITKIHAVRWIPDGEIRAIFQIVHGMQEHIDRYEEFAEFLADKGYLVIGNDHLGHGKSASADNLGYICKNDPATVMVRDVHRLKKITQEEYPGVPIIILGHSMGSFILRNYLSRYGTGIDGAIIMGSGSLNGMVLSSAKLFLNITQLFKGGKYVCETAEKVTMASYFDRIENPVTKVDWLCTRREVIDEYIKDELCGKPFTVNAFLTLLTLIKRMKKKSNVKKIPKKLPILVTSGTEDPVGEYGKAIDALVKTYKEHGIQNLTQIMYEGLRHEILNETIREKVFGDVYNWTETVINK